MKSNRGKNPPKGVKQKKAIELLTDQIVNGGTFTIEELLLKAGYAPETARQQAAIMAGIRPHLEPIIEEMRSHRDVVIARMKKKVTKASYADLISSLDKLTKNIQLLSGKATSTFSLSDEDREAIADLVTG